MVRERKKPNISVTILLYLVGFAIALFMATMITAVVLMIADYFLYSPPPQLHEKKVWSMFRSKFLYRANPTFAAVVFVISLIANGIWLFGNDIKARRRNRS